MKEQIYSSEKLIGKTIVDSAFINNIDGHELLFLIFNDDTFVCLETKENYNILSINVGSPIDIQNFYYKDLVNIGIITQEEIDNYRNKKKEDEEKEKEGLEKQLYERLKKKFELKGKS